MSEIFERLSGKPGRWSRPLLVLALVLGLSIAWISQNEAAGQERVYVPIAQKAALSCEVPGVTYQSLPIIPPPTPPPVELHPDINLAVRGYEHVDNVFLGLVNYDGAGDALAPQLKYLFGDQRLPVFSNAYQVYRWNWECGCTDGLNQTWPTTHLGMAVAPGEVIHVPDSGYDIGGGNDVLILYANEERMTLKYTREDSVAYGYTIHLEGVCPDPDLLALYESWDAAGRAELPALTGGQPLGRAIGGEISVSIRDTGSFLDPRSRKDWWLDK